MYEGEFGMSHECCPNLRSTSKLTISWDGFLSTTYHCSCNQKKIDGQYANVVCNVNRCPVKSDGTYDYKRCSEYKKFGICNSR